MFVQYGRSISRGQISLLRHVSTATVRTVTQQRLEKGEDEELSDNAIRALRLQKKVQESQVSLSDNNLIGEYTSENSSEILSDKKRPKATKSNSVNASLSSPIVKSTKPRKSKANAIPARLAVRDSNDSHHDLASFLEYSSRVDLNPSSTFYTGTHYEYKVADALKTFGFSLSKTGGANDLGIDLVGEWALPGQPKGHALKVLGQCKAMKPTPAMIRELEGAYVGAPSGWNGPEVLALLVARQNVTKGVRAALQRSKWPMGFMQVTREGEIKQFIWNPAAAILPGLESLGVTLRYGFEQMTADVTDIDSSKSSKMDESIVLTWKGKPWRIA